MCLAYPVSDANLWLILLRCVPMVPNRMCQVLPLRLTFWMLIVVIYWFENKISSTVNVMRAGGVTAFSRTPDVICHTSYPKLCMQWLASEFVIRTCDGIWHVHLCIAASQLVSTHNATLRSTERKKCSRLRKESVTALPADTWMKT